MHETPPIPMPGDKIEPETVADCDREFKRLEREITALQKAGLSIREKGQERARVLLLREKLIIEGQEPGKGLMGNLPLYHPSGDEDKKPE